MTQALPRPVPYPTLLPGRSRLVNFAWVLFGLAAAVAGVVAGYLGGMALIGGDTTGYAGALLIATVPLGWLVVGVATIAFTVIVESRDRTRGDGWTRTQLMLTGWLIPVALVIVRIIGPI